MTIVRDTLSRPAGATAVEIARGLSQRQAEALVGSRDPGHF